MDADSTTYLGKPAEFWASSLQDRDPLVRRLSVYALGEIGLEAKSAVPDFAGALEDEVPFVRVWAAAALVKVEPDDTRAVPVLIAALDEETSFVRSLAAWFLGRLAPMCAETRSAIPALRERLEDDDPSVRTEATLALKKLQASSIKSPA